jgi:hypothetical protein
MAAAEDVGQGEVKQQVCSNAIPSMYCWLIVPWLMCGSFQSTAAVSMCTSCKQLKQAEMFCWLDTAVKACDGMRGLQTE